MILLLSMKIPIETAPWVDIRSLKELLLSAEFNDYLMQFSLLAFFVSRWFNLTCEWNAAANMSNSIWRVLFLIVNSKLGSHAFVSRSSIE